MLELGAVLKEFLVQSQSHIGLVAQWLSGSYAAILRAGEKHSDLFPFPSYWPADDSHLIALPPTTVSNLRDWMFCIVAALNYLHGGLLDPREDLCHGRSILVCVAIGCSPATA